MASACSMTGSAVRSWCAAYFRKERSAARRALRLRAPLLPHLLQMIEKTQDQLARRGRPRPAGRRLADLRLGEAEQQSEGVAVGGDGARTDGPLTAQMLDEEALKQEGKDGRRIGSGMMIPSDPAANSSNRLPATAMRSGTPVRYQ